MGKEVESMGKVKITAYDLTEKELSFLCSLVRAFGRFGLSIKARAKPMFFYSNIEFSLYMEFDRKKYNSAMKNTGKNKIIILSSETIRQRMRKGETADAIAADFGIGRATLFRHLKKAETAHTGE